MGIRPPRDAGYALVLLLGLLAVTTAGVVLGKGLVDTLARRAELRTQAALRTARDALVQYAAWEDNSPGALLCPDADGDGDSDPGCGGGQSVSLGQVPWKTLGMARPQDGSSACIWYALSPGARSFLDTSSRGFGGTQPALNPGYVGTLSVRNHDTGTDTPAIAVLIAPGRALAGQARISAADRCPPETEAPAFLEALDGIRNFDPTAGRFVTATAPAGQFNDRVLPITSKELFDSVGAKVLVELGGLDPAGELGLRRLLRLGHPVGSEAGMLVLDFMDPAVQDAFPKPAAPSGAANQQVERRVINDRGCPRYAFSRARLDAAQQPVLDRDGNVVREDIPDREIAHWRNTIEWLCFNEWTRDPANPIDRPGKVALLASAPDAVVLAQSQPATGRPGWTARVDAVSRTTLARANARP